MKTFKEGYEIKFSSKKSNGFFEYGQTEIVYIDVVHGSNEKNNHEQARKQFLKTNTNVNIVSISYI